MKLFNKRDNIQLRTTNRKDGQISFSQCGEDLIVNYVFRLRGISKPSFIDIGANDPYLINNTAFFYEKGCRGINIDANPDLIKKFNMQRKEDINLNVGISDKEEFQEFYVMADNTLSTFSNSEKNKMILHGKVVSETKQIRLTTIANILKEHSGNEFPDFMNIDVEGMDFQIIKSINFEQSAPKIICVEAAEYSPIGAGARKKELINYLKSQGYYEYANTNLNAIMVKTEFWFI